MHTKKLRNLFLKLLPHQKVPQCYDVAISTKQPTLSFRVFVKRFPLLIPFHTLCIDLSDEVIKVAESNVIHKMVDAIAIVVDPILDVGRDIFGVEELGVLIVDANLVSIIVFSNELLAQTNHFGGERFAMVSSN